MTEIEMLEHLLNNLKQDKPPKSGLLYSGKPSIAENLRYIIWDNLIDYSLAPVTHTVNGFTVPRHEKCRLSNAEEYFVPVLDNANFYYSTFWIDCTIDYIRLERGLVFLAKEDAIANAKAMLGIHPNKE